jgi:hypothetical protein
MQPAITLAHSINAEAPTLSHDRWLELRDFVAVGSVLQTAMQDVSVFKEMYFPNNSSFRSLNATTR